MNRFRSKSTLNGGILAVLVTAGTLVLFVHMTSCNNGARQLPLEDPVNSFPDIRQFFKDPPPDYSTSPFWVWNDRVTREKIDRQLQLFKDQGIDMVFIHPRPGLITEYLSREWMELVRYAVNQAAGLKMKIWLYDENSYPSGFAGGLVPAMMPESYNRGAGLRMEKLDLLSPADSGKFFLVLRKIDNHFANITNGIQHYYHLPGEYYAFAKWFYPEGEAWFGGWSYVDLLAEGVTEKFIKLTMRDYEKTLGDDLGTLVPGIFTDEPNISPRGGDQWVSRWTPELFKEFEKKYGYQLQTYLPLLYEATGDYLNVRHDYYSLLLDLFIERWAKPWHEYTENKSLIWTGHYWEHGWPDPIHGGDNMAMYAWHQMPGIDMLFNNGEQRPDQFGNVRAVKELSSVANQMGRNRTLSETYGGSGWDLTFEDMKRLGDWEYALGVNFMNQHLSYMTIKGARKRDFPQSMSYHAPWWDDYFVLNDYFHRLSFVLSAGKQDNRILILEPTTTAWMHYSRIPESGQPPDKNFSEKLSGSFGAFLDRLENGQVEYDLGSERLISEFGRAEKGNFVVGEKVYELVVLPPGFENFEPGTFKTIKNFLKQGGLVLSFGPLPDRLDGNKTGKIRELAVSFSDQWIVKNGLDDAIIGEFFSGKGFSPVNPESWGGRTYHMRRQLKDGQILFLANFDKQNNSEIQFEISGKSIVRMDPESGSLRLLQTLDGDGPMTVQCTLAPANSALYYIGNHKIRDPDIPPEKHAPSMEPIKTTDGKIKALMPNVLTLDYCDVTIGNKNYKDIYFYNAADSIFKYHLKEPYGFNYNPWSVAVQYRTEILDKNRFDSLSGFDVVFPFYIGKGFIPEELNAVIEWPHLYSFRINGKNISPKDDEWWLDRSFGVLDLTGHLQEGRNELLISIHPMDILAEVEPVYLTGKFRLIPAQKGWIIESPADLELGSWRSQGYPFYAGKVAYTKKFENSGQYDGYQVRLNTWNGTVAEVWVNEERAGIIGWKPYCFDLGDLVHEGENTVSVRVTGSLKNLLGPHHNHPVHGIVTPWSFFYAPDKPPPGQDYHLLDYGLFEDFEITGYRDGSK